MMGEKGTRAELLAEIAALRKRVADLIAAEAERQPFAEALRESEARYRRLVDVSPDAVVMADLEGRIVFASPQTVSLLGLSDEGELCGRAVADCVVESDRERLAANICRLAESGVRRGTEYTALRRDGSAVPVEVSSAVVPDAAGRPKGVMAVVRDISRRKAAAEALQQRHAELQAIYDAVTDGLVIVDIEARQCVLANTRWCEMLGYRQDELPTTPDKVHPPEALPSIEEKVLRHADDPSHIIEEVPFVRKDGSIFFADISSTKIEYEGRSCLISFIRDVTERKQAEEALRASEERFRLAFEEAPVGMVIAVGDGVIVRVNHALCRVSGYESEELIGRHVRDFQHPDDRELSLPFVKKLFAGEISSFSVERRYIAKGGRVFWANATTAAARNPDGSLAFALGVIEDITDRKHARDALLRERQTLRHMLRASDHERQLIAYEIHDGLAQELAAALMQLQSYEHLKEHEPQQARTAYEAGLQMLRQAHFEARRLISGVRPPVLDESGIVAAVAHLIHDHRAPGGPKIQFRSHVSFDRLPTVLENAIYRIAQEALTNACKHSRADEVRVSLVQRRDRVRLEIRDSGIGFDPDAVEGEHFGLEGIRERTRILGGKMSIESRLGEGTAVRVTLPLVEPDLPPAAGTR